jgi:integrase
MAYDLVKTKTPGIYKRGDRYVVTWRDRGKQHRQSFRTMAEAREAQGQRRRRDERKAFSRVTFEDYAREWLVSYEGRTARGLTEGTRHGYKRSLEQWAIPQLGPLRMADVERRDVRALVSRMKQAGVSPATMRAHLVPVKALFSTAVDDEDIRSNPASGKIGLPSTESEVEQVKALTREELGLVLAALPERWRPFFTFLAQTGLRISEAVAITWDDVELGTRAQVKVWRQNYRGKVTRLKTKYSVRNVPLSPEMVAYLHKQRAAQYAPGATAFTSVRGGPVDAPNLRNRVLRPAVEAVGLEWVGFHTFRHTCASMLFASGKNPKQVQRWLGHAKAAFTMDVYVHLMDEGLGDAAFAPMLALNGPDALADGHRDDLQDGPDRDEWEPNPGRTGAWESSFQVVDGHPGVAATKVSPREHKRTEHSE